MSFFSQATRFVQRNRMHILSFTLDMSPGPATYISKTGFNSFNWKVSDVRSPDFVHRRHNSVQLQDRKSPNISKQSISRIYKIGIGTSTHEQLETPGIDQNVMMSELYSRLVQTVKIEITEIRKGSKCTIFV